MDLLTSLSPPVDEQQELSTRALRACLAAEAALASLRAECLPLQSSLFWQGEAGSSRNLELAHRSLQLQIDACESFTLCATAAFKQLCDSYFLPSSRTVQRTKLAQSNPPASTQAFTVPFTRKLEVEYESRSKASKENVNLKSGMQSREETFHRSFRFLPSNNLETPSGGLHMPTSRSLSKSRSSTPSDCSHKSQFADRSNSSGAQTPKEFAGRPDASSSQASAQTSNPPNSFPPVKESSVGVSHSFSFEAKDTIRTQFEGIQSLPCSSTNECAEGSGPSPSSLSLKNLSTAKFQFSGSETVSPRKLQSLHNSTQCLAGNRELRQGNDKILPSFSSTSTGPLSNQEETMAPDHSFPVHTQEEIGTGNCKKCPHSAAHLSSVGGPTAAAPSLNNGSCTEATPHSSSTAQSYQFLDGPCLASAQFRCMESASASVGCSSKHDQCPSSALAATENGGVSMTPTSPTGFSLGHHPRSLLTQPAGSQFLGADQFQGCTSDQCLHWRKTSRPSSSDVNLGVPTVGDTTFDSDNPQGWRSSASHGKLGNQKGLDSSTPSFGFAPTRGRHTHDVPGTNLELLFTPPAAAAAAAYESENPRLPRATAAMNANFGQRFWGGSAFSSAPVTYQMWPYSPTSDARPNSTSRPSNFATQSFAAAQSLPSFTKRAMQESLTAFELEGRTLAQANDLTNWQAVPRLDAEFADESFSAHNQCHNATEVHTEKKYYSGKDYGVSSQKRFQSPSDLHQTTRRQGVASFVDIDSEDDSEDGEDEDGGEGPYEDIQPR